MSYVTLDDHKKPDGSIDWDGYKRAQRQNGEICSRCSGPILFGKGYPDECGDCQRLSGPGRVHHDRLIRCPACAKIWNPGNSEHYEVYAEGDHDVTCTSCDHTFTVETAVSYSFTSPALKEGERDE